MQDLPRLHAEPGTGTLDGGASLPMLPGQAHYLGGVMRRGPGDAVRLFNARDGEWRARIDGLHKNRGSFRIEKQLRPPAPEPGPTLLFAPLKRDATDLVVRMATELGAAALCPVMTERTVAARVNAERWRLISVEAAEQCERLSVPALAAPLRLPELLGGWNRAQPLLAAVERAGAGARTIADWHARADPAPRDAAPPAVLIGPEGGFTTAELALLRGCPGVVAVTLGLRVLRAETAALAALACVQQAREGNGVAGEVAGWTTAP